MNPKKIETRLLKLIDALISRGVNPLQAAEIAVKALTDCGRQPPRPWLSIEEAASLLDVDYDAINRALRAGASEFSGAKKICSRWRIPSAVVYP